MKKTRNVWLIGVLITMMLFTVACQKKEGVIGISEERLDAFVLWDDGFSRPSTTLDYNTNDDGTVNLIFKDKIKNRGSLKVVKEDGTFEGDLINGVLTYDGTIPEQGASLISIEQEKIGKPEEINLSEWETEEKGVYLIKTVYDNEIRGIKIEYVDGTSGINSDIKLVEESAEIGEGKEEGEGENIFFEIEVKDVKEGEEKLVIKRVEVSDEIDII